MTPKCSRDFKHTFFSHNYFSTNIYLPVHILTFMHPVGNLSPFANFGPSKLQPFLSLDSVTWRGLTPCYTSKEQTLTENRNQPWHTSKPAGEWCCFGFFVFKKNITRLGTVLAKQCFLSCLI